ncbi:hypothetical protein [Homoserinibacter sp. GY 40078]|uniref:hypothetical protein n=1 Tax=Homoserinibacter sp. GY 40078 TaxID=2603275 RepID=UPI0011DC2E0A|nr:hypothetical protein [Homoserinibacter sp. GY 40078]TXK18444.1 hypothetical protein FVQ89_00305 [Homoserinibacter sp. GY 40078]
MEPFELTSEEERNAIRILQDMTRTVLQIDTFKGTGEVEHLTFDIGRLILNVQAWAISRQEVTLDLSELNEGERAGYRLAQRHVLHVLMRTAVWPHYGMPLYADADPDGAAP